MNNGVDLVSGNTDTKEPKDVNTDESNGWYKSLLSFCVQNPAPPMKASRHYKVRTYKLIKRKDGVATIEIGVSQFKAKRLRNKYNKEGYRVDLIEECSLTGEITKFAPSTDHIPSPIPYLTNRQKSKAQEISNKLASLRSNRLSAQNAKLNAARDRNKSKVYDKQSGLLVFSGDPGDAVNFIISRVNSGIWGESDWVIYLPKKLHDQLGGVTNA